jgi:DNA uptake protein ComE-like DNA-binding protein
MQPPGPYQPPGMPHHPPPGPPHLPPGPQPQGPYPPVHVNVHNHVQQNAAFVAPPVVIHDSHATAHIIHLVLTLFTCGAWAPIWIIHAIVIAASDRPRVVAPFPPPPPTWHGPGAPQDRNQQALAVVARQTALRSEARRLAATDPMSARQLGVGRRDVPGRTYDDGGLIDINRAPAEVFTQFGGITAQRAAHVVAVREQVGGAFSSVEEMMALAELPPHLLEEINEYSIVIR